MTSIEVPDEISALRESDEAIVVVNNEGLVVLMTPTAEKLWGIDAEDIIGEFVEMLVPSKMRWGHQAYRRGYQVEPRDREMDPGLDPHLERPMDETLVPIHIRLEPIYVNGSLYVAAHITERESSGTT
jgi:PAS domain S-box-containing protein